MIITHKTQAALRLKVTDRCPWNCWWCHNEGTGKRDPNLVGDIQWDENTENTIKVLQEALNFTEVHLTGGEPTAHPNLESVIRGLRSMGLKVKATSIGNQREVLERLIHAGLNGFNFSLHSTNPDLFLTTQVDRNLEWATKQLQRQMDSIEIARGLGASVKVNTVVATEEDLPRARMVVQWARERNIPIRIMNELVTGQKAIDTIFSFLEDMEAVQVKHVIIDGSSSHTTHYELPDGYQLGFKQIRDFHLKTMCSNCPQYQKTCFERFYQVRLERRRVDDGDFQFFVRLCIHENNAGTVMSVEDFLKSPQLKELQEHLMKKSLIQA